LIALDDSNSINKNYDLEGEDLEEIIEGEDGEIPLYEEASAPPTCDHGPNDPS